MVLRNNIGTFTARASGKNDWIASTLLDRSGSATILPHAPFGWQKSFCRSTKRTAQFWRATLSLNSIGISLAFHDRLAHDPFPSLAALMAFLNRSVASASISS